MVEQGSNSGEVKKYKTIYNKNPGTLVIGSTSLNWVPDVHGTEKVSTQQLNRIISSWSGSGSCI